MILAICNDTHETRAIQRRWNIIVNAYKRKGYDEKRAQALTKRYFDLKDGKGLWEAEGDDDE